MKHREKDWKEWEESQWAIRQPQAAWFTCNWSSWKKGLGRKNMGRINCWKIFQNWWKL